MVRRMTDHLSMTANDVEALPEPQAREVLDAWVKAKRPELATALAGSASKPHAKLAKKALYQLQSVGVAVEPSRPAPAESDEAPRAPKNEFSGVLSEQLGTGERAVFFAVPMRGGGLELFQGLVSDEFGIVQFASTVSNRGVYRRRLEELRRDPESRVMLVPFERLRLELGRAMTLNERTKTAYGEEIEQALTRIGVTPLDPDFPVPAPGADDASADEAAKALHALPEIAQWLPSEAHLQALAQRVDAVRSSALALSPEQQEVKALEEARALAAEAFTPALRQLYGRRLWYAGELFEANARPEHAALARAEGSRLFHGAGPSRFAELLFEKVLATLPRPAAAPAGAMPLPR